MTDISINLDIGNYFHTNTNTRSIPDYSLKFLPILDLLPLTIQDIYQYSFFYIHSLHVRIWQDIVTKAECSLNFCS